MNDAWAVVVGAAIGAASSLSATFGIEFWRDRIGENRIKRDRQRAALEKLSDESIALMNMRYDLGRGLISREEELENMFVSLFKRNIALYHALIHVKSTKVREAFEGFQIADEKVHTYFRELDMTPDAEFRNDVGWELLNQLGSQYRELAKAIGDALLDLDD